MSSKRNPISTGGKILNDNGKSSFHHCMIKIKVHLYIKRKYKSAHAEMSCPIHLLIFYIVDWETSFATYIYPFPLCRCECCRVAALACSFSKSTRVSLKCKRYGSLYPLVSNSSSPSDGLSSFS